VYRSGGSQALREIRRATRAAARRRMLQRRRRSAVLVLLLLATGLVVVDLVRGRGSDTAQPERATTTAGPTAGAARTPATARPPRPAAPQAPLRFPVTGPGTFSYPAGTGPVHGAAGTLRRFHVAVEEDSGQDPGAFAAAVDGVFADRRGWTASKLLRLQRVPRGAHAHFTIYLATPGTSERMCAAGGLRTERFTSCRLPGQVIINMARWWQAVPGYGAPVAEYRAYAINHEVGHQLGFGHEACPGPGRIAPVMQQQTLGLRGCRPNGWPYLDGRRYAGTRVP
jgi:hypothetical protein